LSVGSNVAQCWNWRCFSPRLTRLFGFSVATIFLVIAVDHIECICVFILFKRFMLILRVPASAVLICLCPVSNDFDCNQG